MHDIEVILNCLVDQGELSGNIFPEYSRIVCTVPEFRARGIITSHIAKCLPFTGSDGNAIMQEPAVSEELLFPSSSPSARNRRRFHQVQSRVAHAADSLTHIQRESILA